MVLFGCAYVTGDGVAAVHALSCGEGQDGFIDAGGALDLQLQIVELLGAFAGLAAVSAGFVAHVGALEEALDDLMLRGGVEGALDCVEDDTHRFLDILLHYVLGLVPPKRLFKIVRLHSSLVAQRHLSKESLESQQEPMPIF